MSDGSNTLQKIVLAEIEGKNRAIHAYDSIIWKVRVGYLTLMFGGWAILLKSFLDQGNAVPTQHPTVLVALLVFSFGFGIGAWIIDRNYVQRKFRVILALNSLIDTVSLSRGNVDSVSTKLLHVAGDDGAAKFHCRGYWQAIVVGTVVYLTPLLVLLMEAFVFWIF